MWTRGPGQPGPPGQPGTAHRGQGKERSRVLLSSGVVPAFVFPPSGVFLFFFDDEGGAALASLPRHTRCAVELDTLRLSANEHNSLWRRPTAAFQELP